MKSSILLSTALMAALLATSCDNDTALQTGEAVGETGAVTFTVHTPGAEKVVYSKADPIHEADEYSIYSLAMYEYEILNDGTTALRRVMKKDGNGNNAINWTKNADNSYTFSIIVPADNDGRKFTYKFVANDAVALPTGAVPADGSAFEDFSATAATITLGEQAQTADVFSPEEAGIAMTGVATVSGGTSPEITMAKGVKCDVVLTRVVSRIDIAYETPNLKVTKVELVGAPTSGTLFAQETLPTADDAKTLGLNSRVALPEDYLNKLEDTEKVELKKAFYMYERANSADDCAYVHIEYQVAANGTDYEGSVDVPFRKTDVEDGDYVDAVRNHLYTIVLGNGKEPISGHLKAKIVVADWTPVEIDEPLTDDDEEI